MNGCHLKRMETSEMLDVLHVLFEEDLMPDWEHGAEVKTKVREHIYSSMYGKNYKYGTSSTSGGDPEWELGGTPEPVIGTEVSSKPFIPASTEEELASIVGPAMGE